MLTLPNENPPGRVPIATAALRCARCGYDLRTTEPDGSCPECGMPLESTRRLQDPRRWPASWLGRQRAGAALLVTCYAFSGVTMVAEVAGLAQQFGYGGWAVLAMQMTSLAMLGTGTWLVTSRPAHTEGRRGVLLVRWLCVAFVTIVALTLAQRRTDWQTGPILHFGVFAPVSALLVLQVVYLAAMGLGFVGLLCVQAGTAARLGARRTRAMLWVAIVCWGGTVLLTATYYIVSAVAGVSIFHRTDPAYLVLVLVGGASLLISSVAYLRTVLRARSLG